MAHNGYLMVLLAIVAVRTFILLVAKLLNARACDPRLPDVFSGWYDPARYADSQRYLRDNTRLEVCQLIVSSCFTLALLGTGILGWLDAWCGRTVPGSELVQGLLFLGGIAAAGHLLGLPFAAIDTFVVEARYGFNRTSVRTFLLDEVRVVLLAGVLGGALLALVLWLLTTLGPWSWLTCWGVVVCFQLFIVLVAPVWIMPLFNRYVPLDEGTLRSAIMDYMAGQGMPLKGIYVMDGSRRSSKSNAFLTGLGRSRRIVLFDTLIEKHPQDQLIAVLAHEVGHYKLHHISRRLVRGMIHTGIMFAGLGWFLNFPAWTGACGLDHSVYAALFLFGVLFEPAGLLLGVVENAWSRRDEYAADAFAVRSTGAAKWLRDGLKRLSVDSLGNLTPHGLTVWLSYSHPPILQRLAALDGRQDAQKNRS